METFNLRTMWSDLSIRNFKEEGGEVRINSDWEMLVTFLCKSTVSENSIIVNRCAFTNNETFPIYFYFITKIDVHPFSTTIWKAGNHPFF